MAALVRFCSCGRASTSFANVRGFQSHQGKCKTVGPARLPPQVPAAVDAEEEVEVPRWEDIDDDGDANAAADAAMVLAAGDNGDEGVVAASILGSRTDDMIAELYRKHAGITISLLEDILRLTRSGPATCRSAKQLFRRIDALPGMQRCACIVRLRVCCSSEMLRAQSFTFCAGLEFQTWEKRVDDQPYTLWSRDLLETLRFLLDRVGMHLEIPTLRDAHADISALWHGRAYQRQLRKFISLGGNLEEDLLLPLVFFSGAFT